MAGAGGNTQSTIGQQRLGTFYQCTSSIDDVVDHQAALAFDVADDVHHLGNVGLFAAFIDDGEGQIEALGEGSGTFDAIGFARRTRQAQLQNLSGSRYNPNSIAIVRAIGVRLRIAGVVGGAPRARSMYGHVPGM